MYPLLEVNIQVKKAYLELYLVCKYLHSVHILMELTHNLVLYSWAVYKMI